jgi:hypothetical protein
MITFFASILRIVEMKHKHAQMKNTKITERDAWVMEIAVF